MGTRPYKPPEVFLGYKKYHYSFDIWSIGTIMASMVYH